MKKRKLIVTGSLAATLLLTGSKATLADTIGGTKSIIHRKVFRQELPTKDVLEDQGFTSSQIQKIVSG